MPTHTPPPGQMECTHNSSPHLPFPADTLCSVPGSEKEKKSPRPPLPVHVHVHVRVKIPHNVAFLEKREWNIQTASNCEFYFFRPTSGALDLPETGGITIQTVTWSDVFSGTYRSLGHLGIWAAARVARVAWQPQVPVDLKSISLFVFLSPVSPFRRPPPSVRGVVGGVLGAMDGGARGGRGHGTVLIGRLWTGAGRVWDFDLIPSLICTLSAP